MISKLPSWVWSGGFVLAFVAGMVNVVGLLGFEHQAVSHLTATTSRLSAALAQLDLPTLSALAALVGSFLFGAILSGWLIEGTTLQLGKHYTAALLLESFFLLAAVVFLERGSILGVYLCCCACGLQNAMASTYSGAIVRTTHMTGIITDLGILIGQIARGVKPDWRRLLLFLALLGGFSAGGFIGAMLFGRLGYRTLLIPASITAGVSGGYRIFQFFARRTTPVGVEKK